MDVSKNGLYLINVTVLYLGKSRQYIAQQFSFVCKNLLLCCQIVS